MIRAKSCSSTRPSMIGSLIAVIVGSAIGTPAVLAAAAPSTPTVDITKFAFTPTEITVAPGSRILWVNHDEVPHTVTGDDKHLASRGMDTDDRYEHVFAEEGDYTYHCAVHPFMIGVVHVRKD
ncbi:MAG: cupredoxin family copper-binding protein [Dokdonella sp.]